MKKDGYLSVEWNKIDYDEIFDYIGGFGKYQCLILILLGFTHFVQALYVEGGVFLQGTPKHRCSIQNWQHDTYHIRNDTHRNVIGSHISFTNVTGQIEYDTCHICNRTTNTDDNNCNGTEYTACNNWVYDRSEFTSTVTSDMNLVCADALKPAHAQMILMGGELVGVFIFGFLSDKYGRKPVICVSATCLLITGIAVTWTHNFISYSVLRFFNGFFNSGCFVTAVVLGIELVGADRRVFATVLEILFFVGGLLFLNFVAYFVRDWRKLNLIITCPFVLQLAYWWILPESPRWSTKNGRVKEATKVLKTIARINGKENVNIPQIVEDKVVHRASLVDVVRSRVLLVRSLIVIYLWTLCTLVYYGFALNSGNLSGDIYIDFALGSLVEIPANLILLVAMDRAGRKPVLVFGLMISGVACLASVFLLAYTNEHYRYAIVIVSLIGKMGITSSFSETYIYTAELFPTVIRGRIFGIAEVFSRAGGMIAPYTVDAGMLIGGKIGSVFPMIMFGVLSVSGALFSLLLPETLHQKLPETLEDGIQLGRTADTRNDKDEKLKLLQT